MAHPQPQTYSVLRSRIFAQISAPQRLFVLSIALLFVGILYYIGTAAPQALANELAPDAPGGIAGVVRNPQGEPLAGISLSLYQQTYYYQSNTWNPVRTITTGADGTYQFTLLPVGIYRLGGSDPKGRYAQTFYPAASTVYQSKDIIVLGNQVTTIPLTMHPGGQISGMINGSEGVTITNGTVTLIQRSQPGGYSGWQIVQMYSFMGNSGVYSFTNLSANAYRLCVNANSDGYSLYECYDNVYEVNRATDVVVTAGAMISNIDITLGDNADYAQISGRVVGPTNEPLADIYVTALVLPPVAISAADARLTVPTATPLPPTLTPQPILPLPYFEYPYYYEYPYYGYYSTVTDSQGNYRLPQVAAGAYLLQFRDLTNQYAFEYYNNVQVEAEGTILTVVPQQSLHDVNIQLERAGSITGMITILGQPAPNVDVRAERKTPFGWQLIAGGQIGSIPGHYTISGLGAGTYRLVAYGTISDGFMSHYYQGYFGGTTAESAAEITLAVGESKTADIALTGTEQFEGSLSGQITAGGAPLAGAKVALYRSSYDYCCDPSLLRQFIYVYTDAEGRYRVDGLANGQVRIQAADPAGIYATTYYTGSILLNISKPVMVGGGTNVTGINVDLPPAGTISGRVIRRNGQPVANLVGTLYAPRLHDWMYGAVPIVQTDNLQTDANGRYTITGLHPGDYYICFRDQPYGNTECYGMLYPEFYQINERALIKVVAGATTTADILWGPDFTYYLPFVPR